MIWGEKDLDSTRLANLDSLDQSSHMLGFNEPNFGSQVNDDRIPKNQPQRHGDVFGISTPSPLPGVGAGILIVVSSSQQKRRLCEN